MQKQHTHSHITDEGMKKLKETNGKVITCKAAVAWEAKKPLDITDIQVDVPRKGEVRVKVLSNALCHTDIYTLDGHDREGKFPCILGHEAVAIVESVGEGVTSVSIGDVVIPCYNPYCKDCKFCSDDRNNMCPTIRSTQGNGFMPDGTSRLSKDGKEIFHFMGCSTFAEYAVISEISAAKITPQCNLKNICLLGCGVATGWGAVFNEVKMEPMSSVVVFGLGAVGLSVIQAAKYAGATKIIGVDINPDKFELCKKLGATECINPMDFDNVQAELMKRSKWGYDYTFDATGNVKVMRQALEIAHRGWGKSCIIGVAAAGHEIATRPFNLVIGKTWMGTAFGGWKSRLEVPKLVQQVMRNELPIDQFVTHTFDGLENVMKSIDALHEGKCLRAIININESDIYVKELKVQQLESKKCQGGFVKQFKHFSTSNNSDMKFSVFVPNPPSRQSPPPSQLYYLSGLTCSDEQGKTKSQIIQYAAEHYLFVVFPDTSARDNKIEGEDKDWDFGTGAGMYLDATEEKYSKHYQNYTYVTEELPTLVNSLFYVDPEKTGITGHSMGGHGALICHLKNPGKYTSVSAFAPICNPSSGQCQWGCKAFKGYLGSIENGKKWDATELMKTYDGPKVQILIDQGTDDGFLFQQLQPENFKKVCLDQKYPLKMRFQKGYDHSYYFISTFMEDHMKYHAGLLNQGKF